MQTNKKKQAAKLQAYSWAFFPMDFQAEETSHSVDIGILTG